MKKNSMFFIFTFVITIIFSSCQSLNQDKMISTIFQEQLSEIHEIEIQFAKIDSDFLLNPQNSLIQTEKVRSLNLEIDNLLKEEALELQARAKLYALKGKCLLLSEKKANAKTFYEKAKDTYKGEVQTVILGYRLNLVKDDIENQKISSDDKYLLVLEKAIGLYRNKDYNACVSKFDEAFLKLDASYQICYGQIRENAWKLKDISASSYQSKEELTVSQMMYLTASESNLLINYIGSKKLSEFEIYRRLSKAFLTHPLSSLHSKNSEGELQKDENVTRIKCARFLWNLMSLPYEEKIKYSALYKNQKSPIADITYDNPDFDAVLGIIENEILDLPDGENFFPDRNISGAEFVKALKNVK